MECCNRFGRSDRIRQRDQELQILSPNVVKYGFVNQNNIGTSDDHTVSNCCKINNNTLFFLYQKIWIRRACILYLFMNIITAIMVIKWNQKWCAPLEYNLIVMQIWSFWCYVISINLIGHKSFKCMIKNEEDNSHNTYYVPIFTSVCLVTAPLVPTISGFLTYVDHNHHEFNWVCNTTCEDFIEGILYVFDYWRYFIMIPITYIIGKRLDQFTKEFEEKIEKKYLDFGNNDIYTVYNIHNDETNCCKKYCIFPCVLCDYNYLCIDKYNNCKSLKQEIINYDEYINTFSEVTNKYKDFVISINGFLIWFFLFLFLSWVFYGWSFIAWYWHDLLGYKSKQCQHSIWYGQHYICEILFYWVCWVYLIKKLWSNHNQIDKFKQYFEKLIPFQSNNLVESKAIIDFLNVTINDSPFKVCGMTPNMAMWELILASFTTTAWTAIKFVKTEIE